MHQRIYLVVILTLGCVASAASADVPATAEFVSVCGDPGMRQPEPRVLLEGWNFCNRCVGALCAAASLLPCTP